MLVAMVWHAAASSFDLRSLEEVIYGGSPIDGVDLELIGARARKKKARKMAARRRTLGRSI